MRSIRQLPSRTRLHSNKIVGCLDKCISFIDHINDRVGADIIRPREDDILFYNVFLCRADLSTRVVLNYGAGDIVLGRVIDHTEEKLTKNSTFKVLQRG